MNLQTMSLIAAGVIGSCVAVVHGILTQRYMVRPLVRIACEKSVPNAIIRLVPALLHFSTFVWFFGGLALIAAANWLPPPAKITTEVLVGAAYLFGVVGNCWATRGRHPGWMLLAIALLLIAFGSLTSV